MTIAAVEQVLAEPASHTGELLLELTEDQWFERKSSRISPRDLATTLIAMANAEGGVVVVGLHDGRVEGTDAFPKQRNAQMQAAIDFALPAIRVERQLVACVTDTGTADHLLVLTMEPSGAVHTDVRDAVFLRVGDENRRLTFRQRQELTFDKGDASFEARALPTTDLSDLDKDLVAQYGELLLAADSTRMLRARELAVGENLTVAGCLLFAVNPQRPLPEAYVRVLRYRGRERGTGARQQLLEDTRLEGPIPRQLGEGRAAIERLQPVRRALTASGRFGDVPLIPEDAWLEGLVNAVVHRSYSLSGDHIRFEIFDDRMEVSSPGRFPGLVDLTYPLGALGALRFARNPRVARVCSDLQFGQELGEGIRRMFDEMRQAGLTDPVYNQTAGSVRLTLYAEPVDRELEARLPEHARAIMSALREGQRLSTGEVSEVLGLSRPVIQRELAKLRDAGVVEWVGKSPKDPRAYWQIAPT